MAVESPAAFNQGSSYNAEQTRRAVFAAFARTSANTPGIISGGLLSASDCQLTAPGSGLSVNVGTGEMIIGGSEGAAQGGYGPARVTSLTNLSISAANPTNPRIDTVCGTISDSGYTEPTGGSGNQWALQVVTGSPASGATLANLVGAATLPLSSLLLGYVLVPANATGIVSDDILNVAAVAELGLNQNGPWQALTLASGWTTNSSAYPLSARLVAGNQVEFKGSAQAAGAISSGAAMATLPSSMSPTEMVGFCGAYDNAGSWNVISLRVAGSGTSLIVAENISSGADVFVDGQGYTLS